MAILAALLGSALLFLWGGIRFKEWRMEEEAIAALRDGEQGSEAVLAAARLLGEMGSVRGIPGLIQAMSKDSHFRPHQDAPWELCDAIHAIIDWRGPAVVPVLVQLLRSDALMVDQPERIRELAARWLAEIGPEACDAASALEGALHASPSVVFAAQALIEIGAPKDEILLFLDRVLRDPSGNRQDYAVEVTRSFGTEAKTLIPTLIEVLRLKGGYWNGARDALKEFGRDAVAPAIGLLRSGDQSLRFHGAEVLSTIKAPEAIPALISALDVEEDVGVLVTIIGALRLYGPKAEAAIPGIILKTRGDDPVGGEAINALGNIRCPSDAVSRILMGFLVDKGSGMDFFAARALARLSPNVRPAFQMLERVAQTQDELEPMRSMWARCALAKAYPDRISALVEELILSLTEMRSSDDLDEITSRQANALEILGELGSAAGVALPSVVRLCLNSTDWRTHFMVIQCGCEAIARIGTDRNAILPILMDLESQDVRLRYHAIDLLSLIGPAARPGLPELIAALRSRDHRVRSGAARVLVAVGPEAQEAVPALREALKARDLELRHNARRALEKILGEP